MSGMVIRRGVVADAAKLAEFAARTFAEAFGEFTAPDDLAAHLATTYRTEVLAAELQDAAVVTLLAVEDARIRAYAQVRPNPSPPDCVQSSGAFEVQRFYLDSAARGTGLASRLMQAALAAVVELGGRHAWLGVWERNDRARAFYRKAGFVDIGSTVYFVGSDRQTDRVFLKTLPCSVPKRSRRGARHGRASRASTARLTGR